MKHITRDTRYEFEKKRLTRYLRIGQLSFKEYNRLLAKAMQDANTRVMEVDPDDAYDKYVERRMDNRAELERDYNIQLDWSRGDYSTNDR